MRLINIDELELDAEYSDYVGDYTAYSKMQIDFAIEVDAIPIGWIEEWLDNIKNDSRYKSEYVELDNDITRIVYKGTEITRVPSITDMLEDWRKENGVSKR